MTTDNPLAGTVYTAVPTAPTKCAVCQREPARTNSAVAECSHVECPHRRRAWSERPTPAELYRGPWPKNKDSDPRPLE